jgi:glycosyltransferase involved in cell wall biosynthesis
MESNQPKLLYITTHGTSAISLMRGQLAMLKERGFHVTLIASPSDELNIAGKREGVDVVPIQMTREISPFADLKSLRALIKAIKQLKPDIVNAGTPKAGVLGMLASRIAKVPARIYTLRGLRLETTKGLRRRLLTFAERLASSSAHHVICVGNSLRDKYLELKLADAEKCRVLASGSSNGVNVDRFALSDEQMQVATNRRHELDLPGDSKVVGFVGRMTHDKGIEELARSFYSLKTNFPSLRLLLVGDFESGDPVDPDIRQQLLDDPHVIITGMVRDPELWYPLMDVVAYPSHREGFPNVPLEAGLAKLPVVGFKATGTIDAVVDGVTGTLLPIGDEPGLTRALQEYLTNDMLRHQHGFAGYNRTRNEFRNETIWSQLCDLYESLLPNEKRPQAVREQRAA